MLVHLARLVGRMLAVTGIVVSVTAAAEGPQDADRQPSQAGAFLLSPGRAGEIEIGMPIDDLYEHVGRRETRLVDLFYEGFFTPAIEIDLPGSPVAPALIAHIRAWPCPAFAVSAIEVKDPRFRTREGIGVGSTLGDVRRAYAVTLSRAEGDHASAAAIQMSFAVSVDTGDSARVTTVRVREDTTAGRQRACLER